MSLVFSVGKWGGFYIRINYCVRICVGFFAITLIPADIDVLLEIFVKVIRDRKE